MVSATSPPLDTVLNCRGFDCKVGRHHKSGPSLLEELFSVSYKFSFLFGNKTSDNVIP